MKPLHRFAPLALLLFSSPVALGATLTITSGSSKPAGVSVNPGTTGHPMDELHLVVSGGYQIRITGLRVNAQGTLDDQGEITQVRLYVDDGNGVFGTSDTHLANATYSADDGGANFAFTRYINNLGAEDWWVVYDLSASATPADTFKVGFIANADVTAQYRPG